MAKDLTTLEKMLLEGARATLLNSYAPYSNFRVGAAMFCGFEHISYGRCGISKEISTVGQVVYGCNVENASYGLTMCAERGAIFEAVRKGAITKDRPFIAMGIVVDNERPSMPCGACLQVMSEFANKYGTNPLIICADKDFYIVKKTTLNDLLPKPFIIR